MKCVALTAVYWGVLQFISGCREPAACQQLSFRAGKEGEKGLNKPIKDAFSQSERWRREGVPVKQSPGFLEAAGCIAEG